MTLPRKQVQTWQHYFIRILLIICIGGVGPLTYLNTFSPHADLQPYYIAILETPPRHVPPTFWASLNASNSVTHQLNHWIRTQIHTIALDHQFPPGLVHLFASALSLGYIFNVTNWLLLQQPLFVEMIRPLLLFVALVWIAPPKKPPRLSSSIRCSQTV